MKAQTDLPILHARNIPSFWRGSTSSSVIYGNQNRGGVFFSKSNVSSVTYTRTIHSQLHHKAKHYACLVWSSASLWGWAFCLSGLHQLKLLWSKLRTFYFIYFLCLCFYFKSWSQSCDIDRESHYRDRHLTTEALHRVVTRMVYLS